MQVLIIQLRQLGDILLTTAALRAVAADPRVTRVDFLTHPMGRLVLEGNPYFTEHLLYDSTQGFVKSLKLLKTLRSRRYDLVLDFMNNPRSALQTLVTGARERIGFAGKRGFAYSKAIERPTESEYIVKTKARLLAAAGISTKGLQLDLPWVEKDLQPVRDFDNQHPLQKGQIRVVLSPTHRREHRRWPLERYAELARILEEDRGCQVIYLWGPEELPLVQKVQKLAGGAGLIAPKTSFRELAALIGNSHLFVGNSNGPSHVAVATHIPTLQLHGHTDAVSWCPANEKHVFIQSSEFGKSNATLDSITLADVQAKLGLLWPQIQERAISHQFVASWRQT